jgi:thioredoxin-related protein
MQTGKPLFLFGLVLVLCSLAAFKKNDSTHWISLDEAQKQLNVAKKPVLIDLYTDWCSWCKVMDKQTYANKHVADYLKENFYAVKVNAESQSKITWMGKQFAFNSQYKTNDFAVYLTGGQLSYPTTVIIPTDGSGPQAIPGFLKPADFEIILKYFGDGKYGKVPFNEYRKSFKSTW